jgi:hypothetical protein
MVVQFIPDPEIEPIGEQGLNAILDPTQTKDSDGFYVRAGDKMKITGNRKVKVAGAGDVAHVIALMSVHEALYPEGIKASTNLQVAPLEFNFKVLRGKAEGVVNAGDYVGDGSTDIQKWKKVVALSATVPTGSTAVLSTSAEPAMTMAGGILPVPAKGLAWVGAADSGDIEVIV